MKRKRIHSYVTNEVYDMLMDLWHKQRAIDRRTTMSDVIEEAIKLYVRERIDA